MSLETKRKSEAEFRAILDQISFGSWKFQLRTEGERTFLRVADPSGVCNVSGQPLPWAGRWHPLSPWMTKSEVVQTAFHAAKTAMEHEIRERFKYRGRTVFGPHFNVDLLWDLCGRTDHEDVRDAKAG